MDDWLEVEMGKTVSLYRKILEKLNDIDIDAIDHEDMAEIHHIYKTLLTIEKLRKHMKK